MKIMKSILQFLFLFMLISTFYSEEIFSAVRTDSTETVQETFIDSIARKVTQKEEEKPTISQPESPISIKEILEQIDFEKIFWVAFILIVGYFILKILSKALHFLSRKIVRYSGLFRGMVPIIRLSGWLIIAFIIVDIIIQPHYGTIVAVVAVMVIALGLAAQDLVKNIIGGIMILFERPFQSGDKIKVGEVSGEVRSISLRSTRIITPDGSIVFIPNAAFMHTSVSNSNYGERHSQVVAEIFLPINIDTTRVREIAQEAARVSRYIYLNKEVKILFINEVRGRKAYLKMRVKAYVMDINYEDAFSSEMTEIVVRELLKEGIITKDSTV